MQPLRVANVSRIGPERCARELLAAVPAIMRFIRQEMRGHRQRPLTVPQFRSLVFLNMHEDASLSAVAEHVGLSLPAASRLVELLVKRGFIERRARSNDRRSVALTLTGRGRT
ncbi:MAG TPA: MarR family transcriptional regulator, partial [Phycisphaerae bacterium]